MTFVESYYSILSSLFSPVLAMPLFIAELSISLLIIFLITLVYRFTTNQTAMRELKQKQQELSAKMKELQKTNPEEANKVAGEVLKLTNVQMKENMKPMMLTMAVVFLFLPWFGEVFIGPIVTFPLFNYSVGWLGWYIVISIPFTQLFRKLLGVE